MALKNCPSCGKKMSNKAPACPHCGFSATAAPEAVDRMAERRTADRFRRQQMLQMVAVIILMIGGWLWWSGGNEGAATKLASGQALLVGAILLYVYSRGAMLWDKYFRK